MILFTLLKNEEFKGLLGKVPDSHVAKRFNISQMTVVKARAALDIPPCPRIRSKESYERKLPADVKVLRKDVEELGCMAAVARKYGVSRQAVSARLERERIADEKVKGE